MPTSLRDDAFIVDEIAEEPVFSNSSEKPASSETIHPPVLILNLRHQGTTVRGKSLHWPTLLGKIGLQVFQAASLAESMAVLGECEKLGSPVGLAVLETDEGGAAESEALHVLRQWRNESELPVFIAATKASPYWRLRFISEGANEYLAAPLDESYVLIRSLQAVRSSARFWNLALEHRNAEHLLRQQKSALFTKDLWRLDLASRTIEFNEHCHELSGYVPAQRGNHLDSWLSLVHPTDLLRLGESLTRTDWQTSPEDLSFEFRLRTPQGAWRWVLIRARLEKDELGQPVGLMGSHTDITNAKTTDSISGLPNRFHFEDWLHQHCNPRQVDLGVFLFGLDRFHLLRDSLGSSVAEQFLRHLGERLRQLASTHDAFAQHPFTIARTSSDEFAIALTGIFSAADGQFIMELVESHLSKGIWVDGRDIFTSFSGGHALRPADPASSAEAKEIWRDAEIALHAAKSAGGARNVAFDANMRSRVVEQMHLENELNRAIENWEFEVYYQPKVTLNQERVIGFEALLRWRHPEKGIIPPSQFIPLAESNGLIIPLGIRTIREACKTIKIWQQQFPQDPPLEVSVNLSVRQFRDTHLVEEIRRILDETGILPSTLQFEVTESVLIEDPEEALTIVETLRAMGVGIKIDDFGTGYSSLSYLHRLPFDCLKIDRTFIDAMNRDHTAFEIVRAILSLADSLGLNVVAEGVEHRSQAEELRNLGCKYAQGYLFAPPLTTDSATRMLSSQRDARSPIKPAA
jgi:PAS domain S-box-containing protein